jgi:hypothetical protein
LTLLHQLRFGQSRCARLGGAAAPTERRECQFVTQARGKRGIDLVGAVLAREAGGHMYSIKSQYERKSMDTFHFSPKALAGFIFFLLAFGLLISIDQGSDPISQAWPILVFVVGGTFAIYRQMWRARNNSDEIRKAEAQVFTASSRKNCGTGFSRNYKIGCHHN